MEQNLVIIGNSSAARECYWLAHVILGDALRFKGFLAFENCKGNLGKLANLELGNDDDYACAPDDVFVLGIGSPDLRLKAFAKWKERGARFINLIHPITHIPDDTEMGEANIVTHGCHFSCDVRLGNANYLNGSVVLGHDVVVGDGNFFGLFSIVLGKAVIGSGNSFGVHSSVLAKAKIGNNNIIAPGAFIYKGCRDGCLMAGNPAMNIR